MSRRKNGTDHVAAALGISPFGWGDGEARKGLREMRAPVGQMKTNIISNIAQVEGDYKDGKSI